MMLTAILALFLATTAVVINEYFTKKNDTENQLILIADIIAWNSSASLAFNDVKTAQEMLNSMNKQPSLIYAVLYDHVGNEFSAYQSHKRPSSSWTGEAIKKLIIVPKNSAQSHNLLQSLQLQLTAWYRSFYQSSTENLPTLPYRQVVFYDENDILHLLMPILLDGELQGILHLADDQSSLNALLKRFYFIISLIFIFTGICILFVSTKLQQVFLAPLLDLMQSMRMVILEKNFSRRIKQIGKDEFGEMATVYNTMLTEIEKRDEKLLQHRAILERQVEVRTAELRHAKELAETANAAKSQF
ncbi:MAG: CHASE sensor domain-containing protein, partial [Nitrospira sp.]